MIAWEVDIICGRLREVLERRYVRAETATRACLIAKSVTFIRRGIALRARRWNPALDRMAMASGCIREVSDGSDA